MNVLLVTGEDHGPDFGCYGDPYARTPRVDAFAEESLRFTNAYVTQAVCSPGRASILTGLYPHQNGQIALASHHHRMFRDFPTIPKLLSDTGFRTGRIGKLHILPEEASPFDMVWNPKEHWSFNNRDVHRMAGVARDFFADSEQPFFLMANFPDAHLPWLPQACGLPESPLVADDVQAPPDVGVQSERLRAQIADYYNCLERLDTGFGLLLDALAASGKAENTVVIYITDHGPQFSRGKCCVNELALRAPLLVRWPGVTSGGTVRPDLVSQIDVLPTVMDAAGITPPAGLPGRSLRPLAATGPVAWRETIAAEWHASGSTQVHMLYNPQRAIRDARYKLIHNLRPDVPNPVESYYTQQTMIASGSNQEEIDATTPEMQAVYARWRDQPEWELFDLQEDPHEITDLAASPEHQDTLARMQGLLRDWQAETADPLANPALLARLNTDMDRIAAIPGSPAKDPDFHWPYLDYLAPITRA